MKKLTQLLNEIGFSKRLSKDVEDVTADKFEDFGVNVGQLYQTFLKKDLTADPAIAQKIMNMVDTDDDSALASQIKDLEFLVNQLPDKVEKRDKIGIITVNRPEQLNSMNSKTRSEMADSFEKMDNNPEIAVVILTGAAGKAFIAGADIKEFAKMDLQKSEEMDDDWRVTKVISGMKKPVIAMIDGFCLGGGLEIAMSCDLRTSSENSKLGQPEINIGIIPGAGGTQRLTRLIGEGRAMEKS